MNTEKCWNRETLQEQLEHLPHSEKGGANAVVWSSDMAGHAKKCVERYSEKANKSMEQLCNEVASPCLDDHRFKQED